MPARPFWFINPTVEREATRGIAEEIGKIVSKI
jgi:hypothetical protein